MRYTLKKIYIEPTAKNEKHLRALAITQSIRQLVLQVLAVRRKKPARRAGPNPFDLRPFPWRRPWPHVSLQLWPSPVIDPLSWPPLLDLSDHSLQEFAYRWGRPIGRVYDSPLSYTSMG
jgi:hypothetical protein